MLTCRYDFLMNYDGFCISCYGFGPYVGTVFIRDNVGESQNQNRHPLNTRRYKDLHKLGEASFWIDRISPHGVHSEWMSGRVCSMYAEFLSSCPFKPVVSITRQIWYSRYVRVSRWRDCDASAADKQDKHPGRSHRRLSPFACSGSVPRTFLALRSPCRMRD